MALRATFLVCVAVTWGPCQVFGDVWEFGADVPDSEVIAHIKGDISALEKVKNVYFSVPTCSKVTYVNVLVSNWLSTPAVTFNKHVNEVTISYKLLQFSKSSYEIVVKGQHQRNCFQGDKAPPIDSDYYWGNNGVYNPGRHVPYNLPSSYNQKLRYLPIHD